MSTIPLCSPHLQKWKHTTEMPLHPTPHLKRADRRHFPSRWERGHMEVKTEAEVTKWNRTPKMLQPGLWEEKETDSVAEMEGGKKAHGADGQVQRAMPYLQAMCFVTSITYFPCPIMAADPAWLQTFPLWPLWPLQPAWGHLSILILSSTGLSGSPGVEASLGVLHSWWEWCKRKTRGPGSGIIEISKYYYSAIRILQ